MKRKPPLLILAVDSDGELLTSAGTHISGSHQLVKKAKQAAMLGTLIQFVQPFGEYVEAKLDETEPLQILAALYAANPGRTTLLEAPEEVYDWLAEQGYDYGEEINV